MASLKQWISHFKNMSSGDLPPGSVHIVRQRGGGPTRTYYKVQPPTIVSPAQQVVDQAAAKVRAKPVNRGRPKQSKAAKGRKPSRGKGKPSRGIAKAGQKKPKKKTPQKQQVRDTLS
jgi:hypothetical protein